ncbi:aspartate aminotransferase family protein [Siminovitchia acidinfaciens]|uniref:Aspartate aminotransferase family protein n=1 Tax=Siminovitchia acidinfaciens TaxID=2321395 RepID=A0A429XZC4_9BACI|nr:aspartate aminotransferase family protein [Siminovitchia acidinfaciens]RST74144.1 aspartate aminotransferase family protein [Siminovitchia acidinfaciens]
MSENLTATTDVDWTILVELDKKHFLHPTSSIKEQQKEGPALIFTEGNGIYLKDTDGKEYIDGLSSLWNVNIGHGREELGKVSMEQISKLGFSSTFATFSHEPAIRLAAKIAEITPEGLNTTFFTSGGSESNDTAFKLVRHYWKLRGKPEKKKIVSRRKSYHGVAMGATSATGLKPFRDFTTSLAPDFYYVDSNLEEFKAFIQKEGAETIAAFISEPIQGTGGVHLPPQDYFKEIKAICEQYNILFIADEVITGFGRTGTYFGVEQFGIVPDLMSVAKGITSGYAALGGVIISSKIHNDLIELSDGLFMHGYTYSGHPTACAIALKNIEIIEREGLVNNSKVMGEEMLDGFKWLQQEHEIIGEVRGLGLMGAIEIVKDKKTNERFNEPFAPKIVSESLKRGLIHRGVVYEGADTLIFAPPLIIDKYGINKMINILNEAIGTVNRECSV